MDDWIISKREAIISDTVNLLRIKSVKDVPLPNAPFGQGNAQALAYALGLCEKMGFDTVNNAGYYGYAQAGEGSPLLGILVHLDVVPEGEGWTFPPFSAMVCDGKIYARGAIDDKAPAVAAIYALKAAQEKGFKGRVRIIFGCDEESGWGCINRYKECEEIPDFSFSPDAEYPIINTEKCIMHIGVTRSFKNKYNLFMRGGSRPNVVPDEAIARIDDKKTIEKMIALGGLKQDDYCHFIGKSAHASRVEFGENALFAPITALSEIDSETGEIFSVIKNCIVDKVHGEGFGIDFSDELSGRLTVNLGVLTVENNELGCVLDIRVPVSVDPDIVLKSVRDYLDGFAITLLSQQNAHHVDAESELVRKLLETYHEVMCEPAFPCSTGGGTYARAFPNAVAFGAAFPDQPHLEHQKDEYITTENLLLNARIFAHTIIKLMN